MFLDVKIYFGKSLILINTVKILLILKKVVMFITEKAPVSNFLYSNVVLCAKCLKLTIYINIFTWRAISTNFLVNDLEEV